MTDRPFGRLFPAVAVEVFNERGYDGTSMEDLARRLGSTKSAIHLHVQSGDALVCTIASAGLRLRRR